jgi:Xaa-Pro aminopeptidase
MDRVTNNSSGPDRLAALRGELARQDLAGFIVPRADEHLGEYVPPGAERLAWLTGFTGSAGLAAVLPDRAAVFTDGRYVLQLAAQTDAALWERQHITDTPPPGWLAQHAPAGAAIGYDPMLIAEDALARYTEAGLTMRPVAANPVDAVWPDRPPPPVAPAEPYPLAHAGVSAAEKRDSIAQALRAAKQDAAVISDPASIAWLLNIRGADVPFTPFALGFALIHADARTELFMDPAKLPDATRAWRRWPARWRLWRGRSCAWMPPAPRCGSRNACAQPAPRWPPAQTRACCPRRGRTRPSSRARATPMPATRWRCAGSCICWRPRARPAR